jgi:hypothetical protein
MVIILDTWAVELAPADARRKEHEGESSREIKARERETTRRKRALPSEER